MEPIFLKWTKWVLLLVLGIIVTFLFTILTYVLVNLGWQAIFSWPGWIMLIGVTTTLATIGIGILVFYSLHFGYNHSYEQVRFAIFLGEHINQSRRKYGAAWKVLKNYQEDLPNAMSEEVWNEVVEALRNCYESTQILNQVAFLIKNRLIDISLVYSFYYKLLISDTEARLRLLLTWCDTGLEKAANYNIEDVKALLVPLKELYFSLKNYHDSLGSKIDNNYSENKFQELELAILEYERHINSAVTTPETTLAGKMKESDGKVVSLDKA